MGGERGRDMERGRLKAGKTALASYCGSTSSVPFLTTLSTTTLNSSHHDRTTTPSALARPSATARRRSSH